MNECPKILVVDDDVSLLRLMSMRLTSANYDVLTCESGEKALAYAANFRPQVVITDLKMDGMDGIALFKEIQNRNPTQPVIILTAHGTIPDAVEATKQGVFAYLTKPFDSKVLLEIISNALHISGQSAHQENTGDDMQWCKGIISRSPVMKEVLNQARMVAQSDVSVLIQSESGTGKELLARAIHVASERRSKPFIAVNCSAIPEPLLESELFGHSKGSFTGATREYNGLIQSAAGGTLFLDEIGDMPLSFQAKMLRVLQEKEVRPVGTTHTVPVDVRVISATHNNLEKAVNTGQFREDLYYRLNVVNVELPPLRERCEDIPLLASHFLMQVREKTNKKVQSFSPEAMTHMVSVSWPGNVRQLLNVVEHCTALATTPIIPLALVKKALHDKPEELLSLAAARDRFERDYIVRLLQITDGNVTKAAHLAQRNRTELYKLLKRHHLNPHLFRESGQ